MNDEFKRCPKCEQTLPMNKFHRANRRTASYCKACMSLYCHKHYMKNADEHNARRREAGKKYRIRNRNYLVDHLRTHPCIDCGETDPVVLEFDHIERENKKYSLSYLSRTGCPLEQLKLEMSKCVVRCVHCHRRRTARQFGWAKGISLLIGM
jgi:hypothetical protein